MTLTSMSSVIDAAKASNNGRLIGLSMTDAEKRAAEKAVARGLMVKHFMTFPGFGVVWAYTAVVA